MAKPGELVVAIIGAAHGVRGELRVKSFTAVPADFAGYGPFDTAKGVLEVTTVRPAAGKEPDMLVARFKGVTDRTAAEKLTGTELRMPRDRLPAPDEDEFYHADLIGLRVETVDGATFGSVLAVQNFGAGDLLEIAQPDRTTVFVPFTKAAVPVVDFAAGRLQVDPTAALGEDE